MIDRPVNQHDWLVCMQACLLGCRGNRAAHDKLKFLVKEIFTVLYNSSTRSFWPTLINRYCMFLLVLYYIVSTNAIWHPRSVQFSRLAFTKNNHCCIAKIVCLDTDLGYPTFTLQAFQRAPSQIRARASLQGRLIFVLQSRGSSRNLVGSCCSAGIDFKKPLTTLMSLVLQRWVKQVIILMSGCPHIASMHHARVDKGLTILYVLSKSWLRWPLSKRLWHRRLRWQTSTKPFWPGWI